MLRYTSQAFTHIKSQAFTGIKHGLKCSIGKAAGLQFAFSSPHNSDASDDPKGMEFTVLVHDTHKVYD